MKRLALITVTVVVIMTGFSVGVSMSADQKNVEKATFAGGCFWCMEPPFEKTGGVVSVVSGYSGGEEEHPNYEQVASGLTGHTESIQITYDPKQVDYAKLLDVFWQQIDPTDAGGQFVDRGRQYRTAIFYHNEEQKKAALESKKALERSGRYDKPVVTEIVPFTKFFPAEDYHQDYHAKNPIRYKFYRMNSGRDRYLEKVWEAEKTDQGPGTPEGGPFGAADHGPFENRSYRKPSDGEIKKKLTPLQYHVTQEEGTEKPFDNEYWNNKREGIYVDIVSGEPLFVSTDKFDSGTGWPSFAKPLAPENILEKDDRSLFSVRTEVRSRQGDSHLGHVFPDGPAPTGLRYCINSAALRFIPKEDLEKEGHGEYLKLFKKGAP